MSEGAPPANDTTGRAASESAEQVTDQPGEETGQNVTAPEETAPEDAAQEEPAQEEPAQEEPAPKVNDLEHEGDIAADYLEELLDIADLDGDLDLDVEGDRAIVSIVGDGLDDLVGRHGEVLDALQELSRLAVLRTTGNRSRLMLDIGGFRERKRRNLEQQAREVVAEVRDSGEAQKMSPMTPFERKVVHDAVAAAGLKSESEGEEPQRCVVVLPS